MLLRMVAYAPFLAAGGIVIVVRTGADMEWIILLAVALLLALVAALMGLAMPKFKKMQSLIDRVNLIAREILTGLPVIRAFGNFATIGLWLLSPIWRILPSSFRRRASRMIGPLNTSWKSSSLST